MAFFRMGYWEKNAVWGDLWVENLYRKEGKISKPLKKSLLGNEEK